MSVAQARVQVGNPNLALHCPLPCTHTSHAHPERQGLGLGGFLSELHSGLRGPQERPGHRGARVGPRGGYAPSFLPEPWTAFPLPWYTCTAKCKHFLQSVMCLKTPKRRKYS